MIGKLLIPLDGSDDASVALDVAADIAAKYGSDLKILHVGLRQPGAHTKLYDAAEKSFEAAATSGAWTSDYPDWPRRLQILDHMGHMILEDGKARAKSRGATSVETMIDWGDEGERILHHSKHPAVDMIVMGSRGASPMEGLFLGSVSHKVFHLATCTCVTVHASEGQRGLERLKRILVPFDGSSHAMKAVELASDLAAKFSTGIKVIHVLQHGEAPKPLLEAVNLDRLDSETRRALEEAMTIGGTALGASLVWPPIPLSALKKVGEEILRGAKEKAERKGVTDVESELVEGDPAEVILQAIEKDRADMVIMGMRGLGEVAGMLLGSVSYKVNHLAPCTCVTVR